MVHALRDCLSSRDILQQFGLHSRVMLDHSTTCKEWLEHALLTLNYDTFTDLVVLLSNIWNRRSSQVHEAKWRKSPPGTVKINFDGSYSATERTAAIGILARDGTRLPLAGSANFISPATDASTVEAHACYHCYSFNIIFAIKNTFYVLN
ncbi:hypothetical protein V6N12_063883 [Hibiscus sabdariffa]|uniref:RNase H type-1 domain-containing protein n=1 Tax=Hibiscus sabdariffa TaxID=183260 RepID=A0ABR2AQY6_9ROSI